MSSVKGLSLTESDLIEVAFDFLMAGDDNFFLYL